MPNPLLPVPNTDTFTLKDVCNSIYTSCIVGNDSTYIGKSLSECVNDMDVNRLDNNYSSEVGLKKFKNYGNIITIVTYDPTPKYNTVATGGGDITLIAGQTISSCGFCWNTTGTPTILNNKSVITPTPTIEGFYEVDMGMSVDTTYHIRMYVTNSLSTTIYGNEVTYTHQKVYNTVSLMSSGANYGWTYYLQSEKIMVSTFSADVYIWGYIGGYITSSVETLTISAGTNYSSPTSTYGSTWDDGAAEIGRAHV